MLCLTVGIAFYIILISIVIPYSFANETQDDQYIDDSILLVMMSCAALVEVCHDITNQYKNDRRFVTQKRRCVGDIFSELGPYWTKRSYRMTENEFWKLHNLIVRYYPKKPVSRKRKRRKLSDCCPNKKIQKSLRLSAAIRYFAGGCPLDIMSSHGLGYNDVYNSVWGIIDAINSCPKLSIEFPKCHDEQRKIAAKFNLKSSVEFDNCTGCIDGMLIWTSKPNSNVLKLAKLGCKKFFCGRKKGLGSICKQSVITIADFLISISRIQPVHPIIWLLGHHKCVNNLKRQTF